MNKNIVSERLNFSLKNSAFSQAEIVKKTGINKGALSSYLAGRYIPKQSNIYKLASVLDVSPSWLMGFDVPMRDSKKDVLGNELENLFRKLSDELNIPVNELKNIFFNHKITDNDKQIEINYNNLYNFFLDYFKTLEKYKKILRSKGLMDNNDILNEEKLDELLMIADMMTNFNKKKKDEKE